MAAKVRLQIVHVVDRNAHTVRVTATSGMRLTILAHDESYADGEDGHVFRVLDLLHNLVQRELAEGIDSGGDQDDVLFSFHAI